MSDQGYVTFENEDEVDKPSAGSRWTRFCLRKREILYGGGVVFFLVVLVGLAIFLGVTVRGSSGDASHETSDVAEDANFTIGMAPLTTDGSASGRTQLVHPVISYPFYAIQPLKVVKGSARNDEALNGTMRVGGQDVHMQFGCTADLYSADRKPVDVSDVQGEVQFDMTRDVMSDVHYPNECFKTSEFSRYGYCSLPILHLDNVDTFVAELKDLIRQDQVTLVPNPGAYTSELRVLQVGSDVYIALDDNTTRCRLREFERLNPDLKRKMIIIMQLKWTDREEHAYNVDWRTVERVDKIMANMTHRY